MLSKIKKILGVGAEHIAAQPSTTATTSPPNYLPESEVPENGVDAVATDGSTWEPWRVDSTGEQWFQRVSHAEQLPAIEAIDGDEPVDWAKLDDKFYAKKVWWNRQENFPNDEGDIDPDDDFADQDADE